MPSLNDYLKKLLYQYDCVVVPELGAFLTHYQPASFTEATGQYLPPRKRVAFNEALRLDDGILINYIMLHESVTRDVAQRQISQFVSSMRQQVTAQGRFDLESIGAFSQNDENRLQFEPSLRHNFFDEAYGMSTITATALDQQLSEPVLNATPVTALGPVLVNDEDVTYLPVQRSGQQRYGTGWRVAAAMLLVGSLGLVSYFSVIDPSRPFQSGIDPTTLLRLPESWRNRASSPRASAVVKTVSPAPRPVEESALSTAPVAEPTPVTAPVAVVVPTPAPVTNRPAVKPTPTVVAPPVVGKEIAPATRPKTSGPFFTVIAGSFANKTNAYNLRRTLRKAGYSDAYIIPPATRKQLYKVAASGSALAEEATASADTISALVGAKAWVMRN